MTIHKQIRLVALVLVLAFLVPLVAHQPNMAQQTDDDVLHVDVTNQLGQISPYIFGTNHGPWAHVSVEMLPKAFESGIKFVRFPGGRWGDENNLRPEQIDLFMYVIESMNAEPLISVRLEGGTPQQAADLVTMVNIEKGHNVRYWSIGNEPDLFRDYSVEQLITEWRAIAIAMREVDPNIILVGPDISQYPPTLDSAEYLMLRRDWLFAFLQANGDLLDIVGIHRYPFPLGQILTTTEDLRYNTDEWETLIPDLRQLIQDATGRDLPIAVTEINSHWNGAIGGEATPDSFYNALWYADFLGRMIKHRAEIVAHFTLATPGSYGGWGLLDRYAPRPSYYVFRMYDHFGSEQVWAESSDRDVTLYASLTEEGDLTLMIINLSPDTKIKTLSLNGFTPSGDAQIWLFDENHPAEQLDSLPLHDGSQIELPPQSMTLYHISP